MAVITVDDVRLHLMDFDSVNAPLYLANLQDSDILYAINAAVGDFNETPPILGSRVYTIDDFPFPQLLKDGAVVNSLKFIALKELRGEMQYSDGGISSTISYKFAQFNSLRQEYSQNYERDMSRKKRHLNMQACYGGIW